MATLVPFQIVVAVSVRFTRRVTTCVLGETTARAVIAPCRDILLRWSSSSHVPLCWSRLLALRDTSTSTCAGIVVVSSRTALIVTIEHDVDWMSSVNAGQGNGGIEPGS